MAGTRTHTFEVPLEPAPAVEARPAPFCGSTYNDWTLSHVGLRCVRSLTGATPP